MTEKQFKAKFRELAKNVSDHAEKKAMQLIRSGAIDLDDYENNYRLPKLVLKAAFNDAVAGYRPLNDNDRETAKNLMLM